MNGNKVFVIVPKGKIKNIPSPETITVLEWPSVRPTQIKDAWFLLREMKGIRPDCFIANFGSTNLMVIIGMLYRIPVRIVWYHTMVQANIRNSGPKTNIQRLQIFRKKYIYRGATHIVVVSKAAADDIQSNFNVRPDAIKVFHNLLDDPGSGLYENRSVIPLHFCSVGRLVSSKGFDILIQAAAKLCDEFPDLLLKIIGDGPLRTELTQLADAYQVGHRISFLGSISHKAVLSEMASSYATIHPTRDEAFGLVVMESLAVGTPVIASNVGGVPEIIRDGIEGLLVPSDSPEALAYAIRKLILSRNLRDVFSKNARTRYLDQFEMNRGIERLCAWIDSIF